MDLDNEDGIECRQSTVTLQPGGQPLKAELIEEGNNE